MIIVLIFIYLLLAGIIQSSFRQRDFRIISILNSRDVDIYEVSLSSKFKIDNYKFLELTVRTRKKNSCGKKNIYIFVFKSNI